MNRFPRHYHEEAEKPLVCFDCGLRLSDIETDFFWDKHKYGEAEPRCFDCQEPYLTLSQYNRKKLAERINLLERHSELCRAWKLFVKNPAFSDVLIPIGLEVSDHWYQTWDSFDCTFPELHDVKVLRKAIQSLMRPGFEVDADPRLFKRHTLYDNRAYASFPLSAFVETTSSGSVIFSLPLPMVFAVSSFRMKRCRKKGHDGWWGRLYLVDGRLPESYRNSEVEELLCGEGFTREEMFETLLGMVKLKEDKYLFTITGDSLIGAIIKAESESLILTDK